MGILGGGERSYLRSLHLRDGGSIPQPSTPKMQYIPYIMSYKPYILKLLIF